MGGKITKRVVVIALGISILMPCLAYLSIGVLYAAISSIGYFLGFLFWQHFSSCVAWRAIKAPYIFTLLTLLINWSSLFESSSGRAENALIASVNDERTLWFLAIQLLVWLVFPFLLLRDNSLGSYFAWAFFTTMGVTEFTTFVVPVLLNVSLSYFPGMVSVLVIAPLAWWGIWRMIRNPAMANADVKIPDA